MLGDVRRHGRGQSCLQGGDAAQAEAHAEGGVAGLSTSIRGTARAFSSNGLSTSAAVVSSSVSNTAGGAPSRSRRSRGRSRGGQLAGQVAVPDAGEDVGQPVEVDEAVGRVLEEVVAVDQEQRELDVGRGLTGSTSRVARGSGGFVRCISSLAVTIVRQLLDDLCYRSYVRQL